METRRHTTVRQAWCASNSCHGIHPASPTSWEQHIRRTAKKYLKQLLSSILENCDCLHFVGDRYDVSPAENLKGAEREMRMKTCPSKMREYTPHDMLAIPEWNGWRRHSVLFRQILYSPSLTGYTAVYSDLCL